MDQKRVQSQHGVTLVGGGDVDVEILEDALKTAPTLVAADGGADHALAHGHIPEVAIGDLDSISAEARERVGASNIIEAIDQNKTDFEKSVALIDAPLILGVGFFGGRLDHSLAALSALVQIGEKPVILVGAQDVVFSAPSEISLEIEVGSRFSVFPLAEMRAKSQGLEWPLDPHLLSPLGRIGTSNRVSGPVHIIFDRPGAVLLTPRAGLETVVKALTG